MQEVVTLSQELPNWLFPVIALAIVLIVNRAIAWGLKYWANQPHLAHAIWRRTLLIALNAPMRALVWLIGLSLVVQNQGWLEQYPELEKAYPATYDILILLAIAWFAGRMIGRVEQAYVQQAEQDDESAFDITAVDAIAKLSWALVFIFSAIAILQVFGISITALLAFGGAAGIAVGFAAQSLVANLLGGLTIFASRIFKIGETIILPSQGLSGTVEHIGWRATRVVGFDRQPFYVPNSVFNTSVVVNYSRMTNRKIESYIYLRYEDIGIVEQVIQDGMQYLSNNAEIEQGSFVFRLDSYDERAVKILVYAFTVSTNYSAFMKTKEEVLLAVADIVQKHGGKLAMPSANVSIDSHELPLQL